MSRQDRAARLLVGGIGGMSTVGLLGFIAYDYQTRHPMRQMQPEGFHPRESIVRLHNVVIRALPLLGSNMSLSELKQYDGTDGHATYFAAGGSVYDVSTSAMFASSYKQWAGRDATIALAKMSLDRADINRIDWDSLSDEENGFAAFMD